MPKWPWPPGVRVVVKHAEVDEVVGDDGAMLRTGDVEYLRV
jgi:hypothetical protein